jgi:hypothetical protein
MNSSISSMEYNAAQGWYDAWMYNWETIPKKRATNSFIEGIYVKLEYLTCQSQRVVTVFILSGHIHYIRPTSWTRNILSIIYDVILALLCCLTVSSLLKLKEKCIWFHDSFRWLEVEIEDIVILIYHGFG